MSRPNTIDHRRGTTFAYAGFATLPAGVWTAASSLETGDGTLVAVLAVTLAPLGSPGPGGETHSLILESTASESAGWPLGTITGDIVFADAGGVVLSSPRFFVNVQRGVTNAG